MVAVCGKGSRPLAVLGFGGAMDRMNLCEAHLVPPLDPEGKRRGIICPAGGAAILYIPARPYANANTTIITGKASFTSSLLGVYIDPLAAAASSIPFRSAPYFANSRLVSAIRSGYAATKRAG